ncbi:putative quinol monooxygenase [Chitinophaga nivalis]|uniref:Antibiotic biosynthesis monooxygenase n=1 Tax=Chitinophaga nivalis TaxID=2991709 RepID=A0ABT3IQZ5_9BACT|nr:putative quinol monooxygenase [Chitinophaga nivalis]MCW3463937.1 antibiotic biosynthesis monooxygenase [Chitinophaga nivalis]MCW3486373.1 antibiotic biosynthesis monooxygenase [Chitinophaga nivalis]
MHTHITTTEKFVIAKLFIQPVSIEEFRQALETLAIQTRKEPGCIDYTYYPEPGVAGAFTLIEHYRNQESLQHHFLQPYLAAFVKKMEGWKSKDLQVYFLSIEPDALKEGK